MKEAFAKSYNRLLTAGLISLVVNGLLWAGLGSAIRAQKTSPPQTIEISRIVLASKPKSASNAHVIKPKPREKPIFKSRETRVVKPNAPRPKPSRARLLAPSTAKPRPNAPEAPQSNKPLTRAPKPAPQGAHNKILTAKNPTAANASKVLPGGNRDVARPTGDQNFGNNKETPKKFATPAPEPQPTKAPVPPRTPKPPSPEPPPTPKPTPKPTPEPTPKPTPEPTPKSKPEPTPKPTARPTPKPDPKPEPTPRPKPKGPTTEARATRTVKPRIPRELRDSEFKSSVRVRVEIAADGAATPSLRVGSGNEKIDALALSALRKWRWKPALEDGQPVASTQYFRFDFEVN